MKFMQVHTFYESYLEDYYRSHPGLSEQSFQAQTAEILEDGFAASHLFTPYLGAHGFETQLVIANNRFAQARWLQEHGQPLERPDQWMYEVVRRQICAFKPDVLYLTDPIAFDGRFLEWLPFKPRFVLGWRAAEIPQGTSWRGFDLLLSNYYLALERAQELGAKSSAYFMPGFPSRIAAKLAGEPKKYDLVFTGQLSGGHSRRNKILNDVAKLPLQREEPLSLGFFIGHGPGSDLSAGISMHDKGAVWGMDMFRATAQGKIVLNAHIDLADGQVGNMRLFETTGVGSFLLTDDGHDLKKYFDAGREVETYSNAKELTEKIYYYREHDKEREEIARRGQERCLRDYSMEKRADEMVSIIRGKLAAQGTPLNLKPVGEDAAALKQRAAALLKENGVDEAFGLLIRAKALKTPLEGLDLLRAHCFLRMGQPLGALEALREELRHFPANAEAANTLELLQRQMPAPGATDPAFEPEFVELLQMIRPYTMLSEQRLHSLYTLARSVCERDLPGNFVECGVAAGGSSALLAFVIRRYSKQPRRLFSFDSFSGMPEPSQLDCHQGISAESTGWGTGTCAAPEESVREICTKLGVLDLVTTVKGYFEETLPSLRDWVGMVGLLHLDGDWYGSTRAILDNLYDRLMNDALLQVDDYGYWDGCRKAIHEFEAERGVSFEIHPIDGTGVWFAKPDRFPANPAVASRLIDDFHLDDPATKGVSSQMSINERFQLYYALRQAIPETPGLVRFIEIGSYSGASLVLTYQALKRQKKSFQGICVEPGGTEQFHDIIKLLSADVIHLPLFSHEAAKRLSAMCEPDRLPQFIFVDGDHTYPGVRQDILDFYPLLRPGGVMVFHDYLPALDEQNRAFILNHHGNAEPGIRQACQELMEVEYRCERLELPLLYPTDPTQTQPQLPIIPGVFSTVRAYRKPLR
jgi:predicted O-methyltransferase YrrM/tetratricopeptide (TPR) repeat protein